MRSPIGIIALVLLLATTLVACGSGEPSGPRLNVSAASSLREPLGKLAEEHRGAKLRTEFAGSDRIAAAITAGRLPDVVVLAGEDLPEKLRRAGTTAKPVAIASNRLVIAVPSGSRGIDSIEDLGRPGVKLALGSASVPVGSYADAVLARLPRDVRGRILANVKTREPDASGVLGKLKGRAVDAAILYRSDVVNSNGELKAIAIPRNLGGTVTYSAATVIGTPHPTEAEALVASLQGGPGHRILLEQGFGPASAR